MKLISVRKLVILDLALHNRKIILAEFIGTTILGILLGGYILLNASGWYGLWIGLGLLGIGLNYAPLALYGVWVKSDAAPDSELLSLTSKRRYTTQSLLLGIPFLILIIALFQYTEASRNN